MSKTSATDWKAGVLKESFMGIRKGARVAVRISAVTLGGKPCYWIYAHPSHLYHVAEELGGVDMKRMVRVEGVADNQDKLNKRANELVANSYYRKNPPAAPAPIPTKRKKKK